MSRRPVPTVVMHFTHIDHLPTIIREGLLCDTLATPELLTTEAGNRGIKERRRRRAVAVAPYPRSLRSSNGLRRVCDQRLRVS